MSQAVVHYLECAQSVLNIYKTEQQSCKVVISANRCCFLVFRLLFFWVSVVNYIWSLNSNYTSSLSF